MWTIKDFAFYLSRLVRDGILRAVTIVDVGAFLVKSLIPPTRRPAFLDESGVYLTVLAVAFVIAAYRLDRDLRAKVLLFGSTEERALRREIRERLIRLKGAIERHSQEAIPMDQALEIVGIAKELRDGYVIAECEEIKNLLEHNYDSRYLIVDLFRKARKDYDSVRARIGYVLDRIDKAASLADPSTRPS